MSHPVGPAVLPKDGGPALKAPRTAENTADNRGETLLSLMPLGMVMRV